MMFDSILPINRILRPSLRLFVDSASGGSELEMEQVQKKVDASKHSRIPVVKFILLLAVIVLTVIILEHFI